MNIVAGTTAQDDLGAEVEIIGEPPDEDVRSPAEVVRLAAAIAVIALAALLGWLTGDAVRAAQSGLASAAETLPDAIRQLFIGSTQLSVIAVPAAALAALARQRRVRVIGLVVLAGAITYPTAIVLGDLASPTVPDAVSANAAAQGWLDSDGFPGVAWLATVAALATVLGPWMSRRWRRAVWVSVAAVGVLRILAAITTPYEFVGAAALGVAIGSVILLVFGAPERGPAPALLADALQRAGLRLRRLEFGRLGDEGAQRYTIDLDDGTRALVSLVSDDARRRDLLFRLYRYLRVRSVADEETLRTTRSIAEHRALVSLWVRDRGIHTPQPVAVVPVGGGAVAAVESLVGGESFARASDDELTDDVLRALWAQIAALAGAQVAHRDLRAETIRIEAQPGGSPTVSLVDFTWGALGATPAQLGIDLAQTLTEAALRVGPERTVATAHEVLGTERLVTALPYLQVPALGARTRRRLRGAKGLLAELRQGVLEVTGAEDVPLEKLERIGWRQVAMTGFVVMAVYLLLPMLASLPEVWEALQDAEWGWILATLPLVALTYVGSTLNFLGAVPGRLPFWLTYQIQLAGAFLNRVTPKNVGGMALRVRFLNLRGIDATTAAASVGLTSLAGGVSTTVLMVLFFVWAGQSSQLDFSLPSLGSVLVIVVGIGLLLGAVSLTPFGRRLIVDRAWGYVRTAASNLGPLLVSPSKLTMLLGGNAVNTLLTIVALSWTLRAFGVPLPLAQVGVVFLGANLVSNASPTPGGVGVMEASMILLLTGMDVPSAEATSAVLVFRLITFWLVTGPGWIVLRRLRHREVV